MTTDTKCDKHKKFTFEGCPIDIVVDISVKVPISVCAHSEVCAVQFKCMGYTIEEIPCENNKGCSKFNIIQKLNLRIPLKFKADCDVAEGLDDFELQGSNTSKHNEVLPSL